MLAEKVETQEEFAAGMQMGYSLFQGYFFCRPEMMQHRALPSFKLAYLELLRAATAPEFDIQELASKIKHEPSLTFRLLRYLNSAAFGLRSEIHSVAARPFPARRTRTPEMDRGGFGRRAGRRKTR